jgi:hypothetical protein
MEQLVRIRYGRRGDMFVTLDTSQDPMSWLKTDASLNIPSISVTLEASQNPMSWFKPILF